MKAAFVGVAIIVLGAMQVHVPQQALEVMSSTHRASNFSAPPSPGRTPEPIEKQQGEMTPQSTQGAIFLSNNLLRVYIHETGSNLWEYQYAPGIWGESNYHEHFALYSPAFGIAESGSFQISQPFASVNGSPNMVAGVVNTHGIDIQRKVTLPSGNARFFLIDYQITNQSAAPIDDVRFFQAVDFDIPYTGHHGNDDGWYDANTDYIGVRDDVFFRNILVSFPRSDNHSVDYWWTQIYQDWDDGQLSGNSSFGLGDAAVAKQFNLGTLVPQQSRSVKFWVWFGDPAPVTNCVFGQVTNSLDQPAGYAKVSLLNTYTNVQQERWTDAQGNFLFDSVSASDYMLSAINSHGSTTVGFSLGQGCMNISPKINLAESPALLEAAQNYAPVIYQDTDNTKFNADYITAFNYDGNWSGIDNWNNLDNYPPKSFVYWNDGAETDSHYFLQYFFFHPRDWGESFSTLFDCTKNPAEGPEDDPFISKFAPCHENDLEGIAIAVHKSSGAVNGIIAVRHDGHAECRDVTLAIGHPVVFSEAKGHALLCDFRDPRINFGLTDDGVIYSYKDGNGEAPESGNDREVNYALLHVRDLYSKQATTDGKDMFAENGHKFKGNDFGDDRASTPWHLDENLIPKLRNLLSPASAASGAQASVFAGSLYADPARVFASLFPAYTYSTDYLFNPNLDATSHYSPDAASAASSPLGDATVTLPFGALNAGATLTMTYAVPADASIDAFIAQETYRLAGRPVALQARQDDGAIPTYFNAPASIVFTFSPQMLEDNRLNSSRMQIMSWVNGTWQPLATQVDAQNQKATAFIESPGVYALFAVFEPAVVYLPLVMRDAGAAHSNP